VSREVKLSSASPEMDPRTALFLAAMCGQTYMQLQGMGTIRLPEEYELVGTFQAGGLNGYSQPFGFVAKSARASILAFRGTSSTLEWITDFMADQVDFDLIPEGGATHRGFTELYRSARPQVMELLRQAPAGNPLFVTGHSLGGALATLAAVDLAENSDFSAPVVYTFAAPRVGNPVFVAAYNKAVPQSFRIANKDDIVVHLPPLVYQDPRTKTIYYYSHVRHSSELDFKGGGISGNHVLSSYFRALALEEPEFVDAMCMDPIGWCPSPSLPGEGGK